MKCAAQERYKGSGSGSLYVGGYSTSTAPFIPKDGISACMGSCRASYIDEFLNATSVGEAAEAATHAALGSLPPGEWSSTRVQLKTDNVVARMDANVDEKLIIPEYGFLDVTKAPFNVDNTGKTVTDVALQKAVSHAYFNHLVAYFPHGEYLLEKAINALENLGPATMVLVTRSEHFKLVAGSQTSFWVPAPSSVRRAP